MQLRNTIHKKLEMIGSRKHKNSKLLFHLHGILHLLTPGWFTRRRLKEILGSINAFDSMYIRKRVTYYNQQQIPFRVGDDASVFSQLSFKKRSAYYFDFQECIRYFDPTLQFNYIFGDVIDVPAVPSFVKSRPIIGNNTASILFKLNKVRHFTFVNDKQSFQQKKNKLVWRGKAGVAGRIAFVKNNFYNPMFDIGQTNPPEKDGDPLWQKGYMSISEQLQYKCILSIEGFDVASNLKWIMSSNSLCFMKKPIYETWFMEGQLLPGVHYVQLKDDYSDIDEKLNYYLKYPGKALEITRQANLYCDQFRDKKRETLISLLVMKQYFEQSGQLENF
jgi:hypothetical protein